MVEVIDSVATEPQPAAPVTGEKLLLLEQQWSERFGGERLRTGVQEIDGVFGKEEHGGFGRGSVVGISGDEEGDEGQGGRLISLHLLATILLSTSFTPLTRALIIDTTGSFSIHLLASILKSRLIAQRNAAEVASTTVSKPNLSVSNRQASAPTSLPVENSLEEGADMETSIHNMLERVSISRIFNFSGLWEVLSEIPSAENLGPEMIIITNLHALISHLFTHASKADAHVLLSLISRSLHMLTVKGNVLTVVHNTTVSTRPFTVREDGKKVVGGDGKKGLFQEATGKKAALGRVFEGWCDVHLLVSKMPARRIDAELLYGEEEYGEGKSKEDASSRLVVEVLRDEEIRRGGVGEREGRWGVFGVEGGTELCGGPGGERREERGGTEWDVGSVAKIYGFGGRRV